MDVVIELSNPFKSHAEVSVVGVVDTDVNFLVLPPHAVQELGDFEKELTSELRVAEHRIVEGTIIGPLFVRVDGFRWMTTEAFIPSESAQIDRAILGRNPIAQIPAEFDRQTGHLVRRRCSDLKSAVA